MPALDFGPFVCVLVHPFAIDLDFATFGAISKAFGFDGRRHMGAGLGQAMRRLPMYPGSTFQNLNGGQWKIPVVPAQSRAEGLDLPVKIVFAYHQLVELAIDLDWRSSAPPLDNRLKLGLFAYSTVRH
jgi:hypothetical protein